MRVVNVIMHALISIRTLSPTHQHSMFNVYSEYKVYLKFCCVFSAVFFPLINADHDNYKQFQ